MSIRKKILRNPLKGFTLVELLVVVAIIGILMSGALMVGSYVTTNAKIQKPKSVMSALNAAINEYRMYHASTKLDLPAGDLPPHLIVPPITNPPPTPGADVYFSGIVALYNALELVPSCREIMNSIPENNIILYNGVNHVFVDMWNNENINNQQNWLRYEYDPLTGNFPVIRSAGPDLQYGTADDILSTEIDG